jgi:hypothetical protein
MTRSKKDDPIRAISRTSYSRDGGVEISGRTRTRALEDRDHGAFRRLFRLPDAARHDAHGKG